LLLYHENDGVNMRSLDIKYVTGRQLRAARGLIGISALELATNARLGVATVRRAEQSDGAVTMTAANAEAVIRALRELGVALIDADENGGAGVRMLRA
jgi:transcriptional regulator with XRE-family HTH domain